jgi:hypothetical protein
MKPFIIVVNLFKGFDPLSTILNFFTMEVSVEVMRELGGEGRWCGFFGAS